MLKITNKHTGAELQVADNDFFDTMTWIEATRACSELGIGWRLPTTEELKAMYYQLRNKGKGNFSCIPLNYWSSEEGGDGYGDGYMWTYPLSSTSYGSVAECYPPDDSNFVCFVRAVRDI